jgi:pyruvate dehydrogenase E1 component
MNEFYKMPPMPKNAEQGILKGMYRFQASENKQAERKVHLLGSGAILNEAVKAREILENDYGISADVWSVTSYKNLYSDAVNAERRNMLHPEGKPEMPYVSQLFKDEKGVFVAASDYLKALPASISRWVPGRLMLLGTDGYGRSDTRAALRNFFEVDARHIAFAALSAMLQEKKIKPSVVRKARKALDIDPDKLNPLFS